MNILNLILIGLAVFICVFGFLLLLLLNRQSKKFGILNEQRIYSDTEKVPGKTFFSQTLRLAGKPDYLVKVDGKLIPVEYKKSLTPKEPYLNHIMQLMAYCYLVEEYYGERPQGGVIKYPEKEFRVLYTDEAKRAVIDLTSEVRAAKSTGKEFHCKHKEHYL